VTAFVLIQNCGLIELLTRTDMGDDMMFLRQPIRSYPVFPAMTMIAVMAGPTGASARLHELAPSIMVEHVSAIHRPTGCTAVLEFSKRTLLGAFITDPHCLPQGVKARTIPAFPRDFHVPASRRQLLRVR
jgi:hypothetical protein